MIYPTSYNEEFYFCRSNIHGIMNQFGNDFLTSTNIRDLGGYIVFDTSIYNDKHSILIHEWLAMNIFESVAMKS